MYPDRVFIILLSLPLFLTCLVHVLKIDLVKKICDIFERLVTYHIEYFVASANMECCNMNNLNSNRSCNYLCMRQSFLRHLDFLTISTICIAMYNFNDDKIIDGLLNAHQRGVDLLIITDESASKNKRNKIQAKQLMDAGKFYKRFDAEILVNRLD